MSACYICLSSGALIWGDGKIPLCQRHAPKAPPPPTPVQIPPQPQPTPQVVKKKIRHAGRSHHDKDTWCGIVVDDFNDLVWYFAMNQDESQKLNKSNCKKCNKAGGFGEYGDDP